MASRRMTLTHLSVLGALRMAIMLAISTLIIWLVCVVIVYFGLDAAGVWDSVNAVIGGAGGEGTITFGIVIGAATLLGAIMALLMIILAPVYAALYNAFATLVGGVEVTLSDR